jgi:guanylate kinase
MSVPTPGNFFIVAAPSGAGKTSLVKALLEADPGVRLSVSYTTRAPRPGEANGRDYHFVSRERFLAMSDAGAFLESAEVHGNLYGTAEAWVRDERAAGHDVLLEIDWQGAAQVRRLVPDAVGIFVLPPSLEVLAERLSGRGTDAPVVIASRLRAARDEIGHVAEFDFVIINKHFDEAARDLQAIVRAARLRLALQARCHESLINAMK